MSKQKMKVAVFGSLRKGMGNHNYYLKNNYLEGVMQTDPIYTMGDLGGFPSLHKDGHTSITMEVYQIEDFDLTRLDYLEGYKKNNPEKSLYLRETIPTPWGEAFVYIYNGEQNAPKVLSGDWVAHYKQRNSK